ncbi:MAG: transcriptional regulator with XRE-family HTH domain [Zhongshania marina]|jgi:transcriptional regulator with XRE-family HTH domain
MSSTYEDVFVGARILELRQTLGMSQQALADSLGVSLRTFQNYERGDRPVSKDLLSSLHRQHQVDVNWLLSGERNQPGDLDRCEIAEEVKAEVMRGLKKDAPHLFNGDKGNGFLVGIDAFMAVYNQICHIDDPSTRRTSARKAVGMYLLSQQTGFRDTVENDSEMSDESKELLLDSNEKGMKKVKEKFGLEDAGSTNKDTDSDSSNTRSVVKQNIKGRGHQIAGRDINFTSDGDS